MFLLIYLKGMCVCLGDTAQMIQGPFAEPWYLLYFNLPAVKTKHYKYPFPILTTMLTLKAIVHLIRY